MLICYRFVISLHYWINIYTILDYLITELACLKIVKYAILISVFDFQLLDLPRLVPALQIYRIYATIFAGFT